MLGGGSVDQLAQKAAAAEEMVRGQEQKSLLVASFAPTSASPPRNIAPPAPDHLLVDQAVSSSTISVRLVRLFRTAQS